jgi:hypothetical protein
LKVVKEDVENELVKGIVLVGKLVAAAGHPLWSALRLDSGDVSSDDLKNIPFEPNDSLSDLLG